MSQRSILITGCSSGIGYAVAHDLRDAGWRVFASCRKQADCDRLIAEGFESPQIDYADPASISSGLSSVLEATGGTLDALFNNGAYALPGAVEDLPTDGLRAIFEANFFGWHDLTRQVIAVMRAQGHGRIINCSSVLGLVPMRWRGAYVATKFALEGLSDVMRLELRGTGIHVVLIEPGPITSKIRENAIPHFEKWISWETSALSRLYTALRHRLYENRGKDRFELPPTAVTIKLTKALDAPSPKPRYYVTVPTYIMGALRRILSSRQLDWLISKG